mmetsp:Transcript_100730/g.291198  ORF Transcript_100730/g.291198 Transcript_100730/m.291198 type:complete len:306 (+) Transcript_100730:1542-2459(+)
MLPQAEDVVGALVVEPQVVPQRAMFLRLRRGETVVELLDRGPRRKPHRRRHLHTRELRPCLVRIQDRPMQAVRNGPHQQHNLVDGLFHPHGSEGAGGEVRTSGATQVHAVEIHLRLAEVLGLDDLRRQLREIHQKLRLLRRQGPRHGVHDAEGTEAPTLGGDEGATGVETDVGLPNNRGVVGETAVAEGVLDDKHRRRLRGLRRHQEAAEADIPGCRLQIQALFGFEPLHVLVHQGHQADWHVEHRGDDPRNCVERVLGLRMQDAEALQLRQASGLVFGHRRAGVATLRPLGRSGRQQLDEVVNA